jgi:hypothetical protein
MLEWQFNGHPNDLSSLRMGTIRNKHLDRQGGQ